MFYIYILKAFTFKALHHRRHHHGGIFAKHILQEVSTRKFLVYMKNKEAKKAEKKAEKKKKRRG